MYRLLLVILLWIFLKISIFIMMVVFIGCMNKFILRLEVVILSRSIFEVGVIDEVFWKV